MAAGEGMGTSFAACQIGVRGRACPVSEPLHYGNYLRRCFQKESGERPKQIIEAWKINMSASPQEEETGTKTGL